MGVVLSGSIINGETKSEFISRIQSEGRYEDFERDRQAMKSAGVPAAQAWLRLRHSAPYAKSEQVITLPFQGREFSKNGEQVPLPPMVAPSLPDAIDPPMGAAISMGEEVRWVMDNLKHEVLARGDAPTDAAFALWRWAKFSPNNETDFWKTFGSKLMPAQSESARKERMFDDNRRVMSKVEAFIRSLDLEAE